ncbi:hypothetical protein MTO96_042279 [Rhipicephalus appendiculatus]
MWHIGLVPSSVPPYMLTVEVCRCPISMELDTGASVLVMAGRLFKRTFPGVAVEASGVMLRTSSGELSQVQGQAQVAHILFQYRTTPHDVTDPAPCELLLGRMVKTPLDTLHLDLRSMALLK